MGEDKYTEWRKDSGSQIDRMYLRLVQFVQFFCVPTGTQILEMFNRSCGIVCNFNAVSVDLIIPVLVLDPADDIRRISSLKKRMSVCLIQVKCLSKGPSPKAIGKICTDCLLRKDCVTSVNTKLPYISLFLELGNGLNVGKQVKRVVFGDALKKRPTGIKLQSLFWRSDHQMFSTMTWVVRIMRMKLLDSS
jgi:hypothetical protein